MPAGIHHTGREHFGPDFLQETGYLFEEYVGRQLRLIPDADVISEITYRSSGTNCKVSTGSSSSTTWCCSWRSSP